MRMLLATLLVGAAVAAPVTEPATDVTNSGATLNGTVDGPAQVHFQYGTTATYGLTTEPQTVDDAGDVSATISGLTAQTTYHFRIVADGEMGQDRTFTTRANPGPPGVGNQRSHGVGPTSATVTATVNPNRSDTTYYVQYGRSTSYGERTPTLRIEAGAAPVAVTAQLTNLRAYSRYYWRLVAQNAAGTTRGSRRTFRTGRLASSVSVGLSRRTVPWGGETRIGGRVSGVGVNGMSLRLEQQRFPVDQDFTPVTRSTAGRDGGYLFAIHALWSTTRYRVVTATAVPVSSPVVTARSAVKVGIRARHYARRRAAVEGTVLPGVHGTAVLQRKRDGRWRQVRMKRLRPADELRTRYRFKVWRPRKRRPAAYFRVRMAPVRGAHVRGWSRAVKVRQRR